MKNKVIQLLIVIIFLPALTYAQTVTDTVSEQIDCATITHSLKLGSRDVTTGGDVTVLQTFLAQTNYLDSDPTGYFGKATKKAVQAFQASNGISPLGGVGSYTRTKIKELSCTGTNTTAATVTPIPVPNIIKIQEKSLPVLEFSVSKTDVRTGTNGDSVKINWNASNAESCRYITKDSWGNILEEVSRGMVGEEIGPIVSLGGSTNFGRNPSLTFACKNKNGESVRAITLNVLSSETPLPSVKITSPNGGELFKRDGTPLTVTWQSANISAAQTLDVIRLRSYDSGMEYTLATNTTNDGKEVVSLPTTIPVGAYTVEIKAYVNGSSVIDSSDTYFKIVDEIGSSEGGY